MPVYGRDSVPLLLRRQGSYGTAETAGAGKFVSLPCYRNTMGSRRDLYDDKTLGEGRNPGEMFLGFEVHDGEIEVPLRAETIGWHLYALLGAPQTTGTGPYTHVFESGGAMTFHTLGRQAGAVQFTDIGVAWNEMRLRLARESQTQRATFACLGRNEVKAGAVLDATPVAPGAGDLRFFSFDAGVLIDGSAVAEIVDLELTAGNGRTHDQEAVSGDPWALRILEGDFSVTGRARFRFEDATWYDRARAGTAFDLRARWENGATSLQIDVANCKFSADRVPLESGGVLSVTLPFTAAKPGSSEATMTATLVNGLASYANPAP